jgi:hypothetical protein
MRALTLVADRKLELTELLRECAHAPSLRLPAHDQRNVLAAEPKELERA